MQKLRIRIDSHLTLRERIVSSIRNAIINGQLRPGARIAEPELAEKFGISRTP
ncbi:MAG: GntR family transcriptional regulator, partial [Deltaproteobacteria bacterium]|nr:GntR family transcriptional regulator [Deltaproteobacteria bacterium]